MLITDLAAVHTGEVGSSEKVTNGPIFEGQQGKNMVQETGSPGVVQQPHTGVKSSGKKPCPSERILLAITNTLY